MRDAVATFVGIVILSAAVVGISYLAELKHRHARAAEVVCK